MSRVLERSGYKGIFKRETSTLKAYCISAAG